MKGLVLKLRFKQLQWSWHKIKKYRFAYIFILPTVLGMLTLHLIPIVQGIYMSFLNLSQFTLDKYLGAPFVWFKNYYDVLINTRSPIRIGLFDAARNTVIYTVVVTFGTLLLGMLVALMVNREFRGKGFIRTLFLFPWVVPTYVTGLLWGFMWQRGVGIINIILVDILHLLPSKPFWLIGPNTIWAIIIPTIWRYWPFSMLLLLAGMQSIPEELYEAADIDGASGWRKFWEITFPLLRPVWSILILFGLIFNVYSFNIVIMMFGFGAGFPGEWGDLLMTNIFRNSFMQWNFGAGAAASVILMLTMILIVNVWFYFYKKAEEETR
ncbi:ABC transporter permease [candidate division WOR-1 bacterium RIFOXYC2_FULL_37_10]|uniref:ABC transporter permease n=1 Tax=candidate division WOR-1 bacterium RIFOXYB2_FULL_37_13 TaxID=1802579 RepID=A0A1F4SLX2_UNCSA|nr:MAG: ABC transporter permease [candidate division WOR-1 bacterium RIFOXYA2_FULL_37_7]OGC21472.1 MAG: ABC transporter permease [candidate division WOR-1 bacterium RIFOXYB2_FULL_37_13]OGC34686.1 MAG: ABC transporter permease [candidate division WOR-1 bacterium RIFOXYC2_FULL_37_10]